MPEKNPKAERAVRRFRALPGDDPRHEERRVDYQEPSKAFDERRNGKIEKRLEQ